MPTGTASLLVTTTLAILLVTGWLQGLGNELARISDRRLVVWLIIAATVSFVEIQVTSSISIYAHVLLMALLFLRLLLLIEEEMRFTIGSSLLFVGAVLFLIQELAVMEPIWVSRSLYVGIILFLLASTFTIAARLDERIGILLGGGLSAEVFALLLYWPERQWVQIGADPIADMIWFTLGGVVLAHRGWKQVRLWARVSR